MVIISLSLKDAILKHEAHIRDMLSSLACAMLVHQQCSTLHDTKHLRLFKRLHICFQNPKFG